MFVCVSVSTLDICVFLHKYVCYLLCVVKKTFQYEINIIKIQKYIYLRVKTIRRVEEYVLLEDHNKHAVKSSESPHRPHLTGNTTAGRNNLK